MGRSSDDSGRRWRLTIGEPHRFTDCRLVLLFRLSTVPLPSRRLAARESRRYLRFAPQFTVHQSQLTIPSPLTTNNHHSSTLCPRSPCQLAYSPPGSPVAPWAAHMCFRNGAATADRFTDPPIHRVTDQRAVTLRLWAGALPPT
jgi:hypothetical protein